MIGIYFSGTGNTKYCVEKFIKEIDNDAKAYSIEDEQAVLEIQKHNKIVFGFPTQFSNLPKIVKDFIFDNQAIWKDKEIYCLVTMGLFSGDGAGLLTRFIKPFGSHTLGGLHLKMPDCICDEKLLKRSIEENKQLIAKADDKIKSAALQFKMGNYAQEGIGFLYHLCGLFGQRLYFYNKTRNYSDKLKIDKTKCIVCGLCAQVCPKQNIKLNANIVEASNQCAMCYRCVNKCPTQAITLLGKKVIQQGSIEKYLDKDLKG